MDHSEFSWSLAEYDVVEWVYYNYVKKKIKKAVERKVAMWIFCLFEHCVLCTGNV